MKVTIGGTEYDVTREFALERAIVDAMSADANLQIVSTSNVMTSYEKERALDCAEANANASQAWMAIHDRLEATGGFEY